MTTHAGPPARYSAHVKSARAGDPATAELHHHQGRDPVFSRVIARANLQAGPGGRLQQVGSADQMEELLRLDPS